MARWYKMPTRQFYLILIGSVCILCVGLASVIAIPQYKRLQRAHALAATKEPSTSTQNLEALLQQRDAEALELGKKLHGDRANLPEREIEAFVIDRLQSNAWQHTVALQSVVPKAGESIDHFRELIFELSLTGGYENLFDWLYSLRRDLGFVVIKELHISSTGNTLGEPVLQADITLSSYRRGTL